MSVVWKDSDNLCGECMDRGLEDVEGRHEIHYLSSPCIGQCLNRGMMKVPEKSVLIYNMFIMHKLKDLVICLICGLKERETWNISKTVALPEKHR